MSVKSAVITLRSSSGGGSAAAKGAPQAPQNENPAGFSWPHLAHVITAPKPTTSRLGCRHARGADRRVALGGDAPGVGARSRLGRGPPSGLVLCDRRRRARIAVRS